MKSKIFASLIGLVTLACLSSCTKDYICVCSQNGEEKYRYGLTDQYDKGAKEQCDDKQTTLGNSYSCVIE